MNAHQKLLEEFIENTPGVRWQYNEQGHWYNWQFEPSAYLEFGWEIRIHPEDEASLKAYAAFEAEKRETLESNNKPQIRP